VAKSTESSPSWLRAGADQLLRMRKAELDEVFSMSPAGEIPTGRGRGTVLFATGTPVARLVAKLAYLLAWRGKVFDDERGNLRNIVSPFGVRAIRAKVYRDASWTDGHDCIVLDYSKTSLVARWIRDEIREVVPGVYLGQVFWSKARILKFALVFPS
jgi:hypothetical protein